jgi:hypothetical protein
LKQVDEIVDFVSFCVLDRGSNGFLVVVEGVDGSESKLRGCDG